MFARIKNYINRKKNVQKPQNTFRSSHSIIDKIDPESLQSIADTVTEFLDNDDDDAPSKNSSYTPSIVVTPSSCKTSNHNSCHSFHDSHDSGGHDSSSSSDCGGSDSGGGGCGCD